MNKLLIDCRKLTETEELNLLSVIHKFILNETPDKAYVPIVIIKPDPFHDDDCEGQMCYCKNRREDKNAKQ